jgi:hypothetical protein
MSSGIEIQLSVDISCLRDSLIMVLLRYSIREGPVSGSFGGGSGSGKSGMILYHLVGNSSIGKAI